MNLEEYFDASARTSSVEPEDKATKILHSALGITTEVVEFKASFDEGDDTNVIQELGDIFWYIAEGCRGININLLDLDRLTPSHESIDGLIDKAGDICDIAKRIVFYKAEIDEDLVAGTLSQIFTDVMTIIEDCDIDLEDVLERNINKLKIRFPEKFSCEKAINRNVVKEDKAFD